MNTHDKIELPPLPSPFGIVDPDGTEGMMQYTIRDLQDYAKAYARTAIEADRKRRGEPIAWVKPDTVENQFINMRPRRVWWECNEGIGVAIYTAPQPAETVTPRTQFEDARVQKVYEIICGDHHPPYGEHWDGYVSRLIVDALFPAEPRQCTWANVHPDCAARKHVEPVKPRFTTDHTDYINTLRNERDALANAASAAGYSFLKHADGSVRMVPQIKGVAQSEDAQTAKPVNVPLDKAGAVGRAFSLVRRLKDGEPVEDELRQVIRQIAAELVKVPSDTDAKHVQDFINCDGMGAVIVEGPQYSAVVRALLSRYGSTTDESTKQQRKIE